MKTAENKSGLTVSVSCVGVVGFCVGYSPRISKQIYVNIQIWSMYLPVSNGLHKLSSCLKHWQLKWRAEKKHKSREGWTLLGVPPVNPSLRPPPPTPLFSIQPALPQTSTSTPPPPPPSPSISSHLLSSSLSPNKCFSTWCWRGLSVSRVSGLPDSSFHWLLLFSVIWLFISKIVL